MLVFKLKLKYKVNVMEKVNIVALGLSALQKSTLDFAYKRRLERLERPPS